MKITSLFTIQKLYQSDKSCLIDSWIQNILLKYKNKKKLYKINKIKIYK